MRPYHIRYMIAAAAVSATATVLILKVSGNLSNSPLQLTKASATAQTSPTNPSLIISCRNGISWLTEKNTTNVIITDWQSQPIQCAH